MFKRITGTSAMDLGLVHPSAQRLDKFLWTYLPSAFRENCQKDNNRQPWHFNIQEMTEMMSKFG
jgi:hypothetical protein